MSICESELDRMNLTILFFLNLDRGECEASTLLFFAPDILELQIGQVFFVLFIA